MLQLQNITPGSGSAREMSAPLHHVSPTPKGQIGVTTIWGVFEMSSNPSLGMFSKCICHSHCLSHCFFVGQVMFSHHSDQMSQRSKVSKIAFWSCSPNVFVIVIVFVIVFLLVRSCFLTTLIKCLKGQKSQRSIIEGVCLSLCFWFCLCLWRCLGHIFSWPPSVLRD